MIRTMELRHSGLRGQAGKLTAGHWLWWPDPELCGPDSRLAWREEGLCDVFAGEFLLPQHSAVSLAEQTVKNVHQVQVGIFEASPKSLN
jgi:hypothetical protein